MPAGSGVPAGSGGIHGRAGGIHGRAGGRLAGRPLTVLVAPDSFKGSLTSVEVARALAAGWARARPGDMLVLAPLADGGEGTLVAIEAAGGWTWQEAAAHDPLGRPLTARWLRNADGTRAVVELAAASGLSRLAPSERDPAGASTHGTGEVLRAVLDAGVRRIDLGVGGSATTDGGLGILAALGLAMTVEPAVVVHLEELDPRLAEVSLRIACDVTNPLLGPRGAAAVYGPQKGADPAAVAELDAALGRWADALEAATGRRERDTPGAGAAGGATFGLACLRDRFAEFAIVPGVDLVMDAAGFAESLARADLVLTGEGRIDGQTAFGKTALGVARRAQAAGVACIAVGGGVEPGGIAALAAVGAIAVPVAELPQSVEQAMSAGAAPLERCGERIARLVGIGRGLPAPGRRLPRVPGHDHVVIHDNFDDPLPDFEEYS
jgi:glycerate kinase